MFGFCLQIAKQLALLNPACETAENVGVIFLLALLEFFDDRFD